MIDVQDQAGARMLPRVYDLDDHLHLFGGGAGAAHGRPEHLEQVAQRDALRPAAIDEDDLLQRRQLVHVPLRDHLPLEPLLDRRGSHLARVLERDRKSTRLNSSHLVISYAVFCLKKKKKNKQHKPMTTEGHRYRTR